MGYCKSVNGKEPCGNETEPGYIFCTDCQNKGKKKAVQEMQTKAVAAISNPHRTALEIRNEKVLERQAASEMGVVDERSGNIIEQVNNLITRTLLFEEEAEEAYKNLPFGDWIKVDKAGVPQLNPIVGVKERALDRAGRVLPMIAKLGIEQQSAIIEKAQYEGIKRAMSRTFTRLNLSTEQVREANRILAEELRSLVPENVR